MNEKQYYHAVTVLGCLNIPIFALFSDSRCWIKAASGHTPESTNICLLLCLHFPILGGYSLISFSIIKALVMNSRNRTTTLSSFIIENSYN